jgi:hypothetical protein
VPGPPGGVLAPGTSETIIDNKHTYISTYLGGNNFNLVVQMPPGKVLHNDDFVTDENLIPNNYYNHLL